MCLLHTSDTGAGNCTGVSRFLLPGLSDAPELRPLLFGVFVSTDPVTVPGNLLTILAVSSDSHLHTPRCFFLASLSFVDVCFISTTVPRMLVNIQTQSKGISHTGCLTQLYLFMIFAVMGSCLLTVVAYDRCVAICHPLRYRAFRNPRFCGLLVLMRWLVVFWVAPLRMLLLRWLMVCTGTEIPRFFCEPAQIVQVACPDTRIHNIFLFVATALLGVLPLTGIPFSYSRIVSSLMRISSAAGKYEAFSTCGSHLSVVALFYGTGVGIYLTSAVTHSPQRSSIASVMYTVLTPMLNPFIYCLRNKDVKGALGKLLGLGTTCLRGATGLRTKWTLIPTAQQPDCHCQHQVEPTFPNV
ncbi:LOW QUALITY PROTEIN: olfactory receptor 7D4-like [Kogia breviceps]|uniref:LOW QUALITY PROTEIN: olfactory receptor 7D4-like n=1 Tax=Kogia breviceps TaxID=27615 RepID=UPI0034D320C1